MIKRRKIAHLQTIDGYNIFHGGLKIKRICSALPSGNTFFFNTNLHYFEKLKSTIKMFTI